MTNAETPWHRILLATEHTEFDVGAERLAIALGRQTRNPLDIVVPLVLNDELLIEAPELAERFDSEAAGRRGELLRAAEEASMQVDVRVRGDTDASRAIVEYARETRPDLLVIRRRGHRSFLARVMIGEMSGNVASTAPCDVLMVPRACRPWKGAVLAAVDGSSTALHVAATAARVARTSALPLHLVCVASDSADDVVTHARDVLRRAIEALAQEGHPADGRIRVGRAQDEIVAAATDCGADLVVVGRRGSSGALRRAVLGSTAQKVVELAGCPVLVVKT
jgi:nucleotide-binding universal stress UspA family protein